MTAARHARYAVSVIFFLNGAVLASWIPHIPEIKALHGLSDGRLGCVLLAMAAGAILAMPVAGALVGRFGSRVMTTAAALIFAAVLPWPIVSPNVTLLALALFVLGAANGALDVSMNAQALALERSYWCPIMSSFHALFSLGGLVGAGIAAAVMVVGMGREAHAYLTSAIALTTVAVVAPRLVAVRSDARPPSEPTFAWPSPALLGLGGLTFLGLLAEGAMADWSAVYLHDSLGTSASVAATGFAAFSLAMAFGRMVGDRLVKRLGSAFVLRASSTLAAVGLAIGLGLGMPRVAVLGFGAVGFGNRQHRR